MKMAIQTILCPDCRSTLYQDEYGNYTCGKSRFIYSDDFGHGWRCGLYFGEYEGLGRAIRAIEENPDFDRTEIGALLIEIQKEKDPSKKEYEGSATTSA